MKHRNISHVTLWIAVILITGFTESNSTASTCLPCAGGLPDAMTQFGLIPGGDFSLSGAGSQDATVVIFDPSGSGDIIGTASAHGTTAGASGQTTAMGGQLNNYGSIFASAAVTIDPDFAASSSAHSIFDFFLQLVPPAGVIGPVPLIVSDMFNVSFVAGAASAVALVKATADRGASQPLLFADEVFDPGSMNIPHALMVMPNEILEIQMESKANQFGVGGGVAQAGATLSFEIDPGFPGAGSFGFVVSPNLVDTPEPATFWLLGGALCAFASLPLRRGKRSRQPPPDSPA